MEIVGGKKKAPVEEEDEEEELRKLQAEMTVSYIFCRLLPKFHLSAYCETCLRGIYKQSFFHESSSYPDEDMLTIKSIRCDCYLALDFAYPWSLLHFGQAKTILHESRIILLP